MICTSDPFFHSCHTVQLVQLLLRLTLYPMAGSAFFRLPPPTRHARSQWGSLPSHQLLLAPVSHFLIHFLPHHCLHLLLPPLCPLCRSLLHRHLLLFCRSRRHPPRWSLSVTPEENEEKAEVKGRRGRVDKVTAYWKKRQMLRGVTKCFLSVAVA